MFKNVLKWNFLLVMAMATFSFSCDKEAQEDLTSATSDDELLEVRSDPYEGTRGRGGLNPRGCFEFVFPVTVTYPDGGSDEANSASELRQLFRAWCIQNEGPSRPSVSMPFELIIEEDMTVLIETSEDFRAVVADCLPDGPPRPGILRLCFRPVFPLTIEFPDGSTLEVENRFQLKMAYREWHQSNPNATERPSIAFPYDVTLQDGSVITVNSQDDIQALLEECAPDGAEGPCFRPVYPLTVIYPDGTTVSVEDRFELRVAIRSWFTDNPGTDERPVLEYPFEVALQDGTVQLVNNADEIQELLAACGYDGSNRPCFRPVFPLTIAFPDGTNEEVDNRFEFRMAIRAWVIANPDADERPSVAFPYEVLLSDGTMLTIENEVALAALIAFCQD
jgi:invasion protein IalB